MSHPQDSSPPRRGTAAGSRAPRRRSQPFRFDRLETRLLLSTASPALETLWAQPSVTAVPLVTSPVPVGLTPNQVRGAYGLNQVAFLGGTMAGDGSGQTIAIVTAYDDPNIGGDLRQFDRQMGVADPPSFIKYYQPGVTRVDSGWSLETALDVEWAHAIAPRASIVLVEARTASVGDLFGAVNFARSLNGVVAVSMSWGTNEFSGQTAYDGLFTTPAGHIGGNGLPGGVAFLAASGDSGAWSGVSYPSSSPNVVSVGGTTLYLGAGGGYVGELGWTGSTGGFSSAEVAPGFQQGVQAATGLGYGLRTTPDVAAVGDPSTGVAVYSSVPYHGKNGWYAVGGTSASTPQWAGLIAIADQGLALSGKGSIGNVPAALYALPSSAFHPVLGGFNGYSASPRYNLVTGLGTPNGPQLIAGLVGSQAAPTAAGFSTQARAAAVHFTSVHYHFILESGISGAVDSGSGFSTTKTTTSVFPANSPGLVVIVIPVGSGRVLVILQPVNQSLPPIERGSHQFDPTTLASINEQNPRLSLLYRSGQATPIDSLSMLRNTKLGGDFDLESVIDLVEPAGPRGPLAAPARVSRLTERRSQIGMSMSPMARPLQTWLGGRDPGTATEPAPPEVAVPAPISPASSTGREADQDSPRPATRLACAVAMAGAACRMTWKDPLRLMRGTEFRGTARTFRPAVRPTRFPQP